ncbi:MAG: hypothetical protein MUQ10_13690 [Anaerolineae bacterium]|nr:hypothetical protein [Anaerolineae bacterium]
MHRRIGLAFAEVRADVVVAEVDPKTGVAVADEIRALGRRALFVRRCAQPGDCR